MGAQARLDDAHEYALGPIAWILTGGLRQIDGRCRSAQRRPPPAQAVRDIRVGGGTAVAGDALALAGDELEMTNQRRPRLGYVVSDGG